MSGLNLETTLQIYPGFRMEEIPKQPMKAPDELLLPTVYPGAKKWLKVWEKHGLLLVPVNINGNHWVCTQLDCAAKSGLIFELPPGPQ